jgi:hypothetical protein
MDGSKDMSPESKNGSTLLKRDLTAVNVGSKREHKYCSAGKGFAGPWLLSIDIGWQ